MLRQKIGKRFQNWITRRKGEDLMAMEVCWLSDLDKAKEAAKRANKPILVDFFYSQ
jgi:hypothetical protein